MFSIGRSTYRDLEKMRKAIKIMSKSFDRYWLKALDDVADIAQKYFMRQFASHGGEFGTPWKPLAPSTQKNRQKAGYTPSRPILVRRGWLRASVVSKTSAKHRRVITIRGIKLYSTLKTKSGHNLLLIHQLGTAKIPARQIYKRGEWISKRGWNEIRLRFMGMFFEIRREMEAV